MGARRERLTWGRRGWWRMEIRKQRSLHVHLVGQNISNSRHEKFRLWRDDGTDKKKRALWAWINCEVEGLRLISLLNVIWSSGTDLNPSLRGNNTSASFPVQKQPEVLPNGHGAFAETKNCLYRILDSSNSMFLESYAQGQSIFSTQYYVVQSFHLTVCLPSCLAIIIHPINKAS